MEQHPHLSSLTPPLSGTITPSGGGILKRLGSISDSSRPSRKVHFQQLPDSDEDIKVSSTKRYKALDKKEVIQIPVEEELPAKRVRRTRLLLEEKAQSEEEEEVIVVQKKKKPEARKPKYATYDDNSSSEGKHLIFFIKSLETETPKVNENVNKSNIK